MNSALMFSKASDNWSTPQDFYDVLHKEFDFGTDAAATRENNKCGGCYFGPDHHSLTDALAVDWGAYAHLGPFWLNPPYSQCREFIGKAARSMASGCTTVCLVPSRTDTRWWHDHVWNQLTNDWHKGVSVRFIKGRLKFGGATAGAPFPSVVLVFRPVT